MKKVIKILLSISFFAMSAFVSELVGSLPLAWFMGFLWTSVMYWVWDTNTFNSI